MTEFLRQILKSPTPEQQVKKWQHSLRTQARHLDRQLRNIDVEEQKVKRSLKEAGKKGNKVICHQLAKELVRSRKAKERIHTSKAQLNSVSMQLSHQLAHLKLAGSLKKSTEVIHLVNSLVKLPAIQSQMQEMASEMMK
ncbi:Charged multivesicular body protein 3, partial [Coelomomyces lativittatus]